LGKGQEHIERQPAHEGCGIELLGGHATAKNRERACYASNQPLILIRPMISGKMTRERSSNDWAPVHQSIAGPVIFVLRRMSGNAPAVY
jgi:hypothetical protein